MARHFLTGEEISSEELTEVLDEAARLKSLRAEGGEKPLSGKSVALIFEKPSTRTRISFEVGVSELGATPIVLRGDELQLARGESIKDTALVLSRFVHAIVLRTGSHDQIEELARHSSVPVINALTQSHHPCQALADLMTLKEAGGRLEGLKLAYVGDGNNVAHSLMLLAPRLGVNVTVATPEELSPDPEIVKRAKESGGNLVVMVHDPADGVRDADAIYTDVWISMGDEREAKRRRKLLAPFQVNGKLLERASSDAVVLHCLPAHPGEEITEDVLYGERSAVWDQAENRLHAQKALLKLLIE